MICYSSAGTPCTLIFASLQVIKFFASYAWIGFHRCQQSQVEFLKYFNFVYTNIAIFERKNISKIQILSDDYMIPVGRDEILSRFAGIPALL